MKLPIRQPDFNRTFPTSRSFENTIAKFHATKDAPATHEFVPLPEESVDISAVAKTASIPAGLSVRVHSTRMLEVAKTRIVSEHEGRVKKLLLTIPKPSGVEPVDAREARHFETLIGQMGPDIDYVLVAAPEQRSTVENWLQTSGSALAKLTFVDSPVFDFTIWAQDAYVALIDHAGNSVLCEGIAFPRGEDMTVADDIAAQTNIAALPSYMYFQGGNVLGGDHLTLMGLDYIVRNVTRYGLATISDVIERFELIFGTPILPLGGERSASEEWLRKGILSGYGLQPIFHIDMYVTPTGVVGESGKEIVFLGRPRKAHEVTGRWSDVKELNNDRYDRFFEQTAAQLASRFEVRTLPLWITFGDLNGRAPRERFYNLTWNNAIVENDGDQRRVLLPAYSQDAGEFAVDAAIRQELESAAAAEWAALGFQVLSMDGLEDLAYGSGSVHCITKTLRRAHR